MNVMCISLNTLYIWKSTEFYITFLLVNALISYLENEYFFFYCLVNLFCKNTESVSRKASS